MSEFRFWPFGSRKKETENTGPEPEENVEESTEENAEEITEENTGEVTEENAEEDTEAISEEISDETAEKIRDEIPTENATKCVEETAEEIPAEVTAESAGETPAEPVDEPAEENTTEIPEESGEEISAETAQENIEESTEENDEEAQTEEQPEEAEPEKKLGFFGRLKAGLTKTRDNIVQGMDRVFLGYSSIDDDFYEELEEIMIMGDMGIHATDEILTKLKEQVAEQHIHEPQACRELLIQDISEQMKVDEHAYDFEEHPSIVMVIGVNGVGKTTSVGKLAGIYKKQGKKVLIAAADTFRAAAGEQLQEWANRAGVDIISAPEGSDPASVVYDAVCAAKARKADILLCDTAGRLHNKKNLMEELRKMDRIISREYPEAVRENLVVLDGATGQNALSQAREFGNVTDLTGIILTKMDGTSKGGIAVAVQSELHIPVKFIGVGEKMEDLQKFRPEEFVAALFERENDNEQE